jgi:hypothetical protein
VEAACPIFNYYLPSDSYESKEWNTGLTFSEGNEQPFPGGQALHFDDGPVVMLRVEDPTFPIQIYEVPDEAYDECWELVRENVRRFWQMPRVPHLSWTDGPLRLRVGS